MLVLDIDYRPQCVAHAHQVRDLHSMVGRGARTRTFRVRVRVRVRYRRGRLQKRHEGASAKLWLGRGLHTGTTAEPQPRGNARWGRFWVAVLVRVLGLGAMKSQR